MYRLVTESVQQHLQSSIFADPVWMNHLDLVFGNLFLDTLRASVQNPATVPNAWEPLLEQRGDAGIAPLQFALAGMNAHINRDLAEALVTTCKDLQTSPGAGSHRDDFFRINTVLAQVEPTIRETVEGAVLADWDRDFPGLQDLVANFSMVKARETAWANADALWWADRYAPDHGATYLAGLDHLTGLAGRGLLIRLKR
jgi:hypothetical protein